MFLFLLEQLLPHPVCVSLNLLPTNGKTTGKMNHMFKSWHKIEICIENNELKEPLTVERNLGLLILVGFQFLLFQILSKKNDRRNERASDVRSTSIIKHYSLEERRSLSSGTPSPRTPRRSLQGNMTFCQFLFHVKCTELLFQCTRLIRNKAEIYLVYAIAKTRFLMYSDGWETSA
ncbi:uncharacterized protein LOC119989785 [Tripterygium wilfordii]|uniref:uncharacterized protein LOC119989785 n=1 Tax=Tripterygium wilfordii TaxID=458696 RepID=UPI0018F861FD|nr:uncharacterized protein LOC119989785 [Tripterygium wilfordii]